MQKVVEGILIKSTDYSETSLILKVFTENGLESFIYRGAKKNNKHNILQPLSLLILEYLEGKSDLKQIRSISLSYPYFSISFDVVKSSILMFINEFLYKRVLLSHNEDKDLFEFTKKQLLLLDNTSKALANFHLFYLTHLTKIVGIAPGGNPEGQYFQLLEGEISTHPIAPFLDKETTQALKQMLKTNEETFDSVVLNKNTRMKLLNGLIDYFSIHLENKTEIKSLKVLNLVFE